MINRKRNKDHFKLIGWAGVGALAVFKQNLVENLDEHKEKPNTYAQNYTIPRYLKVLMTFIKFNFNFMGQFKEREQTDTALYYYEPPQYYYEEGRSFKTIDKLQTIGPFMVSFQFQSNPNNSHDLCEGTSMFQSTHELH